VPVDEGKTLTHANEYSPEELEKSVAEISEDKFPIIC
jgi:hypothetical protein